jgi:lysophospholipase L1-like esterase
MGRRWWRGAVATAAATVMLSAAGCSPTSPSAGRAATGSSSPAADVPAAPQPIPAGAVAAGRPATSSSPHGAQGAPSSPGGLPPTDAPDSGTTSPTATGAVPTANTVPTADAVPSAAGPANGTSPSKRAAPTASLIGPIAALGDSYTAGNLLPLVTGSTPFGCYRSSISYAQRVAAALHDAAGLVDAACASAGVADITASQATRVGTNPPQLDSVTASDSLVMLTLGGDDLGFLNVLSECIRLSWTNPFGSPCKRHYASGGTDQLAARVTAETPKMATVLEAIRAKAPNARVLLIGYPDLFPVHGGCWPAVPITDGDIAYLRGIELQLNSMLATEAAATGVTFVDTYDATIGHDFCQRSSIRYVEGLLPATLTEPFHPNSRGQAAIATLVLAALG